MTGTTVEFVIDFAFKSKILDAMLAANLDRAANTLIGCFEDRARVIYGAESLAIAP
jgi:coenzyme Q-binding protein COQ10